MKNLEASKNYDMPTFSLGNIMITYLNEGDPANKWEEFKKFNDSGIKAPLLGFNFDTRITSYNVCYTKLLRRTMSSRSRATP